MFMAEILQRKFLRRNLVHSRAGVGNRTNLVGVELFPPVQRGGDVKIDRNHPHELAMVSACVAEGSHEVEYCSACMDFDPDVQRPQKAYGMSEEIVISDTVIRCSNRNRCKNIERYLRKKVTNDGVGKTDEAMP